MCFEAYAAGFFDGEGSISVRRRGKRYAAGEYVVPRIRVGQNNRAPLDALKAQWGGTIEGPITRGRFHAHYRWVAEGQKAINALSSFLPFLVVKRDMALALLASTGSDELLAFKREWQPGRKGVSGRLLN